LPRETVIFEDSEIGLRAAYASGARVEKVANRKDVYFDRIDRVIHEA
jgi:beta-phosphoglucomutase-like phosphatase (HAD superfamily)